MFFITALIKRKKVEKDNYAATPLPNKRSRIILLRLNAQSKSDSRFLLCG